MRKLVLPLLLLLPLSALAEDADIAKPSPAPGEKHSCVDFYPQHRREGMPTGSNDIHFTITETGEVKDPIVVKSSGDTDLDKAALACVAAWLYTPAKKDGMPVAAGWDVTLNWALFAHNHRGMTGQFGPVTRAGFRP